MINTFNKSGRIQKSPCLYTHNKHAEKEIIYPLLFAMASEIYRYKPKEVKVRHNKNI